MIKICDINKILIIFESNFLINKIHIITDKPFFQTKLLIYNPKSLRALSASLRPI